MNDVRMALSEVDGEIEVVKKRVFLKGIEGTFEGVTLADLDGPVALLYSNNEEDAHAPLKAINTLTKSWKKDKQTFWFDYIGWRYDKEWKGKEHVTELANLPTKEELYGKFVFMLNHPVASFARVLNAIAEEAQPEAAQADDSASDASENADG